MGELITAARPYFCWATKLHQATTPESKTAIRRNQIAALSATEKRPHIAARLALLLTPNPEGSSNANETSEVVECQVSRLRAKHEATPCPVQ
jgi:hypothetical protein